MRPLLMNILLTFLVKANINIILVPELSFFLQLLEMKHPSSADHHSFSRDNLSNNKLKHLTDSYQVNYSHCI